MIGTHTDVTDRKEAEDALIIFRETVENSTDAIGISDPGGRHYYQNKAFTELFGDVGDGLLLKQLMLINRLVDDVFKLFCPADNGQAKCRCIQRELSCVYIPSLC
jgi:PAS domain-containing protein